MRINDIINQPEGRRLEFKETLPAVSDIAKTVIAFSNDAGGELFIGIKNNPRELTGIAEDDLFPMEEKISDIIFGKCYPTIIPEITFHSVDDKHFIRINICRGSNLPYYLKEKGKLKGTYIRVGSTNRVADEQIIAELERQKRNISFDGEIVHEKSAKEISLTVFSGFYKEKTNEELTSQAIKKLDLFKEYQGNLYPTNACILFSEDELRNSMFHYAKIECARFKGTTSEIFIDQKTIYSNITLQPEEAYEFVLRHINKGGETKGVYTETSWEYPVKAIREVIRNAVVHRDYSLTGKDIKVAIYDDMVEITSPGKLLPSIDFNDLEARQSDIRNKIIAPVFKKLGIIDQWGNGLKLIADELKEYPAIAFKWNETGMQFQVQFIKKQKPQYESQYESQYELQHESQYELQHEKEQELQQELQRELQQELQRESLYSKVLNLIAAKSYSTKEISVLIGQKTISGHLRIILSKLLKDGLVEWIEVESKSSKQRYQITQKGKIFLDLIEKLKTGTKSV